MAGNKTLGKAKIVKNDEFYTQLSDIENELRHYKQHFKGKVIFCNCDDPYESNFFKYFAMNFNALGLKKLITTCFATSPVTGKEFQYYVDNGGQLSFVPSANDVSIQGKSERKPYKVEITEVTDENEDGRIDLADVEYLMRNKKNMITLLNGDGDFRSPECVELLKEADIVVTNPPFSLFREYVSYLMEYKKQFVIIGNVNAITYKEFFPLLRNNKIWIGFNHVKEFIQPNGTIKKFGNICWYTNLDIKKRHENLILYKNYTPENYPHFDNYDAINVDKTTDIPCDYDGVMGVPITFMDKYSPEQFEIVGYTAKDMGVDCLKFYQNLEQSINGGPFVRNMKSARFSPMIIYKERPQKTCYRASNASGYMLKTYGRILIRRKQVNTNEN